MVVCILKILKYWIQKEKKVSSFYYYNYYYYYYTLIYNNKNFNVKAFKIVRGTISDSILDLPKTVKKL